MNQIDALNHLNKEKEYEDRLCHNLYYYFIESLKTIQDLSDKEKSIIEKSLKVIIYDSLKHSTYFNKMIQLVLENEHDKY